MKRMHAHLVNPGWCSDLQESWNDVRQQLLQKLLRDALHDFGLHLDGSKIDGVVSGLHDGAQHLDALLGMDGSGQRGGRLLSCTHHLTEIIIRKKAYM